MGAPKAIHSLPSPPHKPGPLSCSSLAFALILLSIATLITLASLYFFLFKPLDPSLVISSIRLLSLSPAGLPSAITSVNLTLIASLAVHNPNRGRFRILHGSLASLYYYEERVGVKWMGERSVEGRSSMAMELELTVEGPTPLQGAKLYSDVAQGVLQSGVSVQVRGEVAASPPSSSGIRSFFSVHMDQGSHRHHVLGALCSVNVSLSSRGIEAYACQRGVPAEWEEEEGGG